MRTETTDSISATSEPRRIDSAHVLAVEITADRDTREIAESTTALLNEIVRGIPLVQESLAGSSLIRIPRARGLTLVFLGDFVSPVKCAMEITARARSNRSLAIRMGIHTGPLEISVLTGEPRASGDGIDTARCIMACGDSGHILLSESVALRLEKKGGWIPLLHDYGYCRLMSGGKMRIFNLWGENLGNPLLPRSLHPTADSIRRSAKPKPPGMTSALRSPALMIFWSAAVVSLLFLAGWTISPAFRGIIRDSYGPNNRAIRVVQSPLVR